MAKQELNWGEEKFQSNTYFGRQDAKDDLLVKSAPRDFQMVFMEKCSHELRRGEKNMKDIQEDILSPYLKRSAETRIKVLWPPIDWNSREVESEFREFMPPKFFGRPTEKWVKPHLDRIESLCDKKEKNPYYPSSD